MKLNPTMMQLKVEYQDQILYKTFTCHCSFYVDFTTVRTSRTTSFYNKIDIQDHLYLPQQFPLHHNTVFPMLQKCPKNRSNAIYLQFKEKLLNFHKKRPFGRLRHKKGCLKAKERPYIHYLKH